MLFKVMLLSTALLGGSADAPQSAAATGFDANIRSSQVEVSCTGPVIESAVVVSSLSSCEQAQAAHAAAYEEYYYALNNTQAAVQTYNMCLAGGGDCSFWYDNMISWSNYLGLTESALMYATVEVWIHCGDS